MKSAVATLLVLTLQLSALSYGSNTVDHRLQRRSVTLLRYQIEQALNSSSLQYIGYGCFCGLGGKGNPVDDIDRCCKSHDECYSKVKCKFAWQSYLVNYGVQCTGGQCNCTDMATQLLWNNPMVRDNPGKEIKRWKEEQNAVARCFSKDTESTSPCPYTVCECDRVFAECLKKTRHLMDPKYKLYSKKKC